MDEGEAFFPQANVTRIGNCVMIQCENEDDSVIVFEMFRSLAVGNDITFRGIDRGKEDA